MSPALRALHVIAGIDPSDGGPSYSVPRLCAALREEAADVHLLTVRRGEPPAAATSFPQDFAGVPVASALRLSRGLKAALRHESPLADVIHVHGLWLMPNVDAGRAAARAEKPLVVSPRGMVSPVALRFSSLRKTLFWAALQERAYARAACWHATSVQEAEEIRAFGVTAPVAVIPNGIDLPERVSRKGIEATDTGMRSIVSLGRIHPKKGLDLLVMAWATVAPLRPGWRLRIVGPDEGGHAARLRALAASLGAERVSIEGPVYGEAKWDTLRASDLFVLPTHSENFGLSVAEALGAGLPAIVTRGAPWSGLEREGCGWWVDTGEEALRYAILRATGEGRSTLAAMGDRGRAWMGRDFGWGAVGARTRALYEWLCRRGERPSFVLP